MGVLEKLELGYIREPREKNASVSLDPCNCQGGARGLGFRSYELQNYRA